MPQTQEGERKTSPGCSVYWGYSGPKEIAKQRRERAAGGRRRTCRKEYKRSLLSAFYSGPKEMAKTRASKRGKKTHMHAKSPCIATAVTACMRRRSHRFFARYHLRQGAGGAASRVGGSAEGASGFVHGSLGRASVRVPRPGPRRRRESVAIPEAPAVSGHGFGAGRMTEHRHQFQASSTPSTASRVQGARHPSALMLTPIARSC
jgi:hypothetical protein